MKKIYTFLIALLLSGIVSGQWVQQDPPFQSDLNSILFADELNGWVMSDFFGVNYTSNGGSDWQYCMDLSDTTGLYGSGSSMYFTDVHNGWIRGNNGIWHTSDGELGCESIWNMQDEFLASSEDIQPAPFFHDAYYGWCIINIDYEPGPTQAYVYRTIDGGIEWMENEGDAGRWLRDITFVNLNIGWAIDESKNQWSGPSGLMISTDGGAYWSSINDSIGGTSLFFIDETQGWITGIEEAKGIWHTNDGGITLTQQVGDTIPQLNDITFSDELNGWVVGDEGTILHTSDGGQNWENQESGTLADLHSVCFIDQNIGWICGDSGVILHTDNGGIVGIENNYSEPITFNVFPNPTNSSITIELPTQPSKNTILTISNTNGQQLITQAITKPQTEIDISHLPVGIYIVKVWNDKDVMVRKVIKQ